MEHDAIEALEIIAEAEEFAEGSPDYTAAIAQKADDILDAKIVLMRLGEWLQPASLQEMQEVFYRLTLAERFQRSVVAAIAVRSHLSDAWHGIGPWRK